MEISRDDKAMTIANRPHLVMIAPHFQEYCLLLANAMATYCDVTLMVDTQRLASEYEGRIMPTSPRCSLKHIGFTSVLDLPRMIFILLKTRPGFIHIQEPSGMAKAMLCAAIVMLCRRFTKVILTIHDPLPHKGRDSDVVERFERIRQYIRHKAHLVVVHGQYCYELYCSTNKPPHQRVLISDHGSVLCDTPPDNSEGKICRLLNFGRMEAYKGVDILCEAAQILAKQKVPYVLHLAGSGPELDKLADRFAKLDNVTIDNSFIASNDLIAQIRSANAVILPYLEATQSGVLAAALSNGRFVIASNVGGIPDVVSDAANGLLVPPGDPVALASAIARVATDAGLCARLEQGARETARTQLSWNRIAAQLWDGYQIS